jgi:hypothetical protein
MFPSPVGCITAFAVRYDVTAMQYDARMQRNIAMHMQRNIALH